MKHVVKSKIMAKTELRKESPGLVSISLVSCLNRNMPKCDGINVLFLISIW